MFSTVPVLYQNWYSDFESNWTEALGYDCQYCCQSETDDVHRPFLVSMSGQRQGFRLVFLKNVFGKNTP